MSANDIDLYPDEVPAELGEAVEIIGEQNTELEQLRARVKELEQENQEQAAEMGELVSAGQTHRADGWLIETPEPTYDGQTLGVNFRSGLAFVPMGVHYPQVEIQPVKDGTITKLWAHLPKAEQDEKLKEARKREKEATAERLVRMLINDFGYKATYYSKNDLEQMQAVRTLREQERQTIEEEISAATSKAIVAPGHMGG